MAADLPAVFARIRPFYARHAAKAVVLKDAPGAYILGTHEVREKDGYRTWFGGVEIRKTYVSAHLMPVYADPGLLDGVDPALRKRMQGKSCFNFREVDDRLFAAFEALVEASVARFQAEGRLAG